MLYLIHYDRKKSQLISRQEYPESARETAFYDRHKLEMQYNQFSGEHEIVLLEAASLEQLRQTHSKYVPYSTGEKLFLTVLAVGLLAALAR